MEQLSFEASAFTQKSGMCACGCGAPTSAKYIRGHSGRTMRIDDAGRQCGECREYKPWDSFHVSRTTRYGHVTTCRPCMSAKAAGQARVRQAARPPKVKPACSLPECSKPVSSRGYCKRHYEQWRTQGRPAEFAVARPVIAVKRPDLPGEIWRPVPTWEGLYDVSDHGRVWSIPRLTRTGRVVGGQILAFDRSDPRGYLRVGLKRPEESRQKHYNVHRLVLWAFTGENPADLDTRHLDGNPANNRWAPGDEEATVAAGGNLMFGTRSENAHDRMRHGTWVNNNRFVGATECIHGHEFDEANTYWRPTGGRACKACAREHAAARRAARRAA